MFGTLGGRLHYELNAVFKCILSQTRHHLLQPEHRNCISNLAMTSRSHAGPGWHNIHIEHTIQLYCLSWLSHIPTTISTPKYDTYSGTFAAKTSFCIISVRWLVKRASPFVTCFVVQGLTAKYCLSSFSCYHYKGRIQPFMEKTRLSVS